MRSHEAGALHGQAGDRGPAWLHRPDDVNQLVTHLWSRHAAKSDGVLTVAGESATELAAEFGTPLYVVDEDDFRHRARAFRDAFADADVFYAGKSFLCVATARWVAEEGLNLDVCTGGELAVALRAEFPPARIAFHGNNKSEAELRRAIEVGVGRVIVDSFDEIDRLARLVDELGATVRVMVRVTAGVEAHTHEYISTSHEDQKFGFSIAGGQALEAVRRITSAQGLQLLGLHSHIGSQIFVTDGFEVAARRVLRLQAEIERELGVTLPEASASRTRRRTTPVRRTTSPARSPRSSTTSATRSTSASPSSRSSPAGPSSARRPSRSTRSAPPRRSRSTAEPPAGTSRSTAA